MRGHGKVATLAPAGFDPEYRGAATPRTQVDPSAVCIHYLSRLQDLVFEGYNQTSHDAPMEPVWLDLIRGQDWAALNMAPLKLLVFSGDDDAICGVGGTQRWIFALGLNRTSFWQPWMYE